MTDQDTYVARLQVLRSLMQSWVAVVRQLDLADLRSEVERLETLAPIMEPTLAARGGMDNLAGQRWVIEASQVFLAALEKLDKAPANG